MTDLKKAMLELEQLNSIVLSDIRFMEEIGHQKFNITAHQSWTRIYIRNACMVMEGRLYGLRSFMFNSKLSNIDNLTSDELNILSEEVVNLKFNGDLKNPVRKDYNMVGMTIFTFRMFYKYFDEVRTYDMGSSELQSFDRLIAIRNKLIHPKSPEDQHISDEIFDDTQTAFNWFNAEYVELKKMSGLKLKELL